MADKRAPQLLEERLTHSVIGSFFDVHRELGFGYREDLYALALERDRAAKGHQVDREVVVVGDSRGAPLARQTLDMIVDEKPGVAVKAAERLHPCSSVQGFS